MGTVIRQHLNSNKEIVENTPITNNLSIGMSMDECRNIWGNPQDINKTTTPRGETEMWFYENQKSLIFKNGILKLINE